MAANHGFEYFVLAGDANHDRSIDITDLGILATNWQGTGRTYSHRDFNYDGAVDITDLGILMTNWQATLVRSFVTTLRAPGPARAVRSSFLDELFEAGPNVTSIGPEPQSSQFQGEENGQTKP